MNCSVRLCCYVSDVKKRLVQPAVTQTTLSVCLPAEIVFAKVVCSYRDNLFETRTAYIGFLLTERGCVPFVNEVQQTFC